jgi:hypothetical protein
MKLTKHINILRGQNFWVKYARNVQNKCRELTPQKLTFMFIYLHIYNCKQQLNRIRNYFIQAKYTRNLDKLIHEYVSKLYGQFY